jgi:hypothetical protein
MSKSPLNILSIPLEELEVSIEFCCFAYAHELHSLSDMILIGTRKLEKLSGFNKRLLFEYLQLLEKHDLDEFMES